MMGSSHRLGGAALGILAAGVLAGPDDMAGKAVVLSAGLLVLLAGTEMVKWI